MFHPNHNFPSELIEYKNLEVNNQADMKSSMNLEPESQTDKIGLYLLPNEFWTQRIVGVLGNTLAKQYPNQTHKSPQVCRRLNFLRGLSNEGKQKIYFENT